MRNVLSIGNVTQAVHLNTDDMTLILGQNTDAHGGISRNGAGKTTILQAISFAAFGTPLSRIKVDNLVNNINLKGMMVTLDLSRDGTDYRIERGRKPAILKFYKFVGDEKIDLSQGENSETQKLIDAVIGMGHNMFKHILALNTYTIPFLQMRPAEQREVIEELIGATQITQRADALKKLISGTRDGIKIEEATLKATLEANERIKAAIESAEAKRQAWTATNLRTIEVLRAEIAKIDAIDFDAALKAFDDLDAYQVTHREASQRVTDASRDLTHAKSEWSTKQSEITRLGQHAGMGGTLATDRLEKDRGRKERDKAMKEAALEKLSRDLAKIETDIASPDAQVCVCCNQPLTGTDHLAEMIANMEANANNVRAQIGVTNDDIAALGREIAAIDTEIGIAKETAIRAAADTKLALEVAALEATAIQERIDTLMGVLADTQLALITLGDAPTVPFASRDQLYVTKQAHDAIARELEIEIAKVNPFDDQIASLAVTIKKISHDELNRLQDLYKHQDFLLKILTNKDSFIRKKIIEQNLAYLNGRLNGYLEKLGLPHEVIFRPDLSVDISLLGRDLDFEQLSRGEMNRVIMSTSWAFRDVWESLNFSINLLFVDEMLDQGTDAQGAEAALNILKGMGRDRGKNVFLISHRDELQGRIGRTLMASKENGFTRYHDDDL